MRTQSTPKEWHQEKTYESLMTYGTSSIKFVFLANGGAIISILAFLGEHPQKITAVKFAIWFFVLGVIAAGAVNVCAYLTQLALFNQSNDDDAPFMHDHKSWLGFCLSLIIFGILCFAIGSVCAVNGLGEQ